MTVSAVGFALGFSRRIIGVSSEIISACSSRVNKLEITPKIERIFRLTKLFLRLSYQMIKCYLSIQGILPL
jgi:hypothetical protein